MEVFTRMWSIAWHLLTFGDPLGLYHRASRTRNRFENPHHTFTQDALMTVPNDEAVASCCQKAVAQIDHGELQLRHIDRNKIDRIHCWDRVELASRVLVDDVSLQPANIAKIVINMDAEATRSLSLRGYHCFCLLVLSEVPKAPSYWS